MPSSAQKLILVVDDDADARMMLQQALTSAGFTVALAGDGSSALLLLSDIIPGLILLDAVMPGLDGFETCRRIKAEPQAAAIPVIFMTGLSESAHVVAGLAAGGVDYVTKPIMLDELIARIHVHLENGQTMLRTQNALKATARRMIATDESGEIRWTTPLAAELLAAFSPDESSLIEGMLARIVATARANADKTERQGMKISLGTRQIELSHIGHAPPDEHFFRIAELREGLEPELLQRALDITPRESEVLFWIAQGKSNRDASEILNISARTVNKHLEQIFIKLGVENRAAAAAIATRIIALQE
jgi:DNA-binding response OmpR family regulator/DNA-binding CsgD family transcriptional regulator